MKKKLLNMDTVEKICKNCAHGRHTPDGDGVLCVKKGVMLPFSSCRKFEYDPLNRTPAQPVDFGGYSAEEFKL